MTGKTDTLVSGDTTYTQWSEEQDARYGVGTVDKMRRMNYNKSTDRKQFEAYKQRLGTEAPQTFKEFQKLKYDNPNVYNDLSGYYRYLGNNPDSNRKFYNANKAMKALHMAGAIKTTGTVTIAPKDSVISTIKPHAVERMAERNITQEMAQRIIDNADFAIKQRQGTQYAFYSKEGFSVLESQGLLGTVGLLDKGGKLLYDEVIKHVTRG